MSIHAIYIKSRQKSKWHLFSMVASAEAAIKELDVAKKQALSEGNEDAKVAIKYFDTIFYIPEYISEIKEEKPIFN